MEVRKRQRFIRAILTSLHRVAFSETIFAILIEPSQYSVPTKISNLHF